MSVWLYYSPNCDWLAQLVLFDGENTYWSDNMRPSNGYTESRLRNSYRRRGVGYFKKIGNL